jgi:hypothetical protein
MTNRCRGQVIRKYPLRYVWILFLLFKPFSTDVYGELSVSRSRYVSVEFVGSRYTVLFTIGIIKR